MSTETPLIHNEIPPATRQSEWISNLKDIIAAIEDGRIAQSRRAVWMSNLRKELDFLRDQILLNDLYPENAVAFMKLENSYLILRAISFE